MSKLSLLVASLICALPVASVAFATPSKAASFAKICYNGSLEGTGTGANQCPANPVQGQAPNEWGCTLDRATNDLWEVKTQTGLTDFRSTFSNVDNSVPGQVYIPGQPGPATTATASQLNAVTNSIGYVNRINQARLCNQTGWKVPTLNQYLAIRTTGVSPQLPAAYFPDLGFQGSASQHGTTATSTQTFNNPTMYQSFQVSNGALRSTYRVSANELRLVARWAKSLPCGTLGQPACTLDRDSKTKRD